MQVNWIVLLVGGGGVYKGEQGEEVLGGGAKPSPWCAGPRGLAPSPSRFGRGVLVQQGLPPFLFIFLPFSFILSFSNSDSFKSPNQTRKERRGLGAAGLEVGPMRPAHTRCGAARRATPLFSGASPLPGKPPKLVQNQIYSIDKIIDSID